MKKHKKTVKTVKKHTKPQKKALISHQTKVDQLQTQLNDTHGRLDSILRVYGDEVLLDYLVRGIEHEVANLTPTWFNNSTKPKKELDKQALYYKSAKDENEELMSQLKKAVNQRIKIAKLYRP